MLALILGLLLLLGTHSVRIVADDWRNRQLARLGEKRWKALYGVASLLGFGLVVWGFGLARGEAVTLWIPPHWTRSLAALLTLPAFVLLVAAYVPANRLKADIGHPMMAGVALWALAHLLANGSLAQTLLFGSFLIWAVAGFVAARRRDRVAGTVYPTAGGGREALAIGLGIVAWILFAVFGHTWLIGTHPFF